MSEGIQGNTSRQPSYQNQQQQHQSAASTNENSAERETAESQQLLRGPARSFVASPGVGALLVEAYAKVVLKKQNRLSPNKVLFEYARFLVGLIEEETTSRGDSSTESTSTSTKKEALALLEVVNLAFGDQQAKSTASSWDPSFVRAVVIVLETHPDLQQVKQKSLDRTLAKLRLLERSEESWAIDIDTSDTTSSTIDSKNNSNMVSGIGERISLSGDNPSSGAANIIADVGPSCTRSAATFREVLKDAARTSGPLDEGALANLIYFFSNKSSTNNDKNDGKGSDMSATGLALLGSILSGRGDQGSSTDGNWNLKIVMQVLNEDFGASTDWPAVARKWDFATFLIEDANHLSTLLELYQAAAGNPPPLQAFTTAWQNSNGQLSLLEALIALPPAVFTVPLSEEELADAAVAPSQTPQTTMNPQCWASMDILQRLLYLSDVPSLYRRVRDLFVKCLLSCPEVLLCSLVRLQLRVSNARGEPGSDALAHAGIQIKTELMRELIPLFFRPNAHHRVQNGPAALRRLYAISPSTVTAACFEVWRSSMQENPGVRLSTIIHIINIARLLPSPTEAVASLLNGAKDAEFSIAVAFVMSDNDFLQLKPWLGEKLSSKGSVGSFAISLVSYLKKTYASAAPRPAVAADGRVAPLVSLENIATSLQLLQALDSNILSQGVPNIGFDASVTSLGDCVKALTDACSSAHPSLRSSLSPQQQQQALNNNTQQASAPRPAPGASDDVEELATAYFQKIYTSEQSIGEVVEMLKRFKTSGNSKENEIFACMVHNLFDEYRFFSKYPEPELRITGILFGALIQEQLVSSITLGIALRYVLEALRKPPSPQGSTTSSGKMFKFGMFALEQFKGRLHEWPQYCSHIVQIPHLKEEYANLVAEIEHEMTKNQNRAGSGNAALSQPSGAITPTPKEGIGSSSASVHLTPLGSAPGAPSLAQNSLESAPALPRVAEFGPKLGRAVTEGADEDREFEAPPDSILDRVQFLVNNLAPSNVEKKSKELKEMLDPKFFGWLGHFLVVKRISTQANYHSLYLSFLDQLGDYGKGLVEAILSSAYHNIGKLLRSPKITTSSSERSYLKNLGIWLGQITLSRNRPILQIMLDCKELLLQGYENGKLIAVAPFLAKTLEGAKSSVIFRPPNPWLMAILGAFRSVYNVEGLKMNIKFEVEVLCKNLGIKLEEIPLRDNVLAQRIAPEKERNPDFNIRREAPSASAPASAPRPHGTGSDAQTLSLPAAPGGTATEDGSRATSTGQDQHDTVIPNLAAYVTVNASLPQLLQSQSGGVLGNLTTSSLKRWVPIAVDRAIREIIQPVVERSVTIACITTKEIVTKDFAMESDETKMRKAGQLMVANLAGSLALVTCREPLRSSVSTHLRQLLTTNLGRTEKVEEQNVIEQCVQICATDNLELGCMLIEKAATEKAVRDVDEALSTAMNARRKHREQTGQPFYDMSIFSNGNQRYPSSLPDKLRPKPGGLRAEHFQLYDSFQRLPRANQGLASMAASGSAPTAGLATARPSSSSSNAALNEVDPVQPLKQSSGGMDALASLATKLDNAVSSLLSAAGTRASDIKLAMLPPDHQIRQFLSAVNQIMPNATSDGAVSRQMTTSEQELVLGFSQSIFKRLYDLSLSEPLRLEALVTLLENINVFCPKLGKDMGTWARYAPTNTEPQRRLHRTVLLLLVRSRLLSVHDLDSFLAARADNGRNHMWVEFSLVFIRTAFMERISSPVDFPKLIDLMSRIADGRSQAPAQVVQSYRKPVLRMLEETRGLAGTNEQQLGASSTTSAGDVRKPSLEDSSSLSPGSLSNLTEAPKKVAAATDIFTLNDPANARQQVTALLDSWIRLQSDPASNEKAVAQFMQILQQYGVGKVEEQTERFLRLSSLIVVDAVLKSAAPSSDGSRTALNYTFVDLYSKLLVLLFRHMNSGGSQDQVDAQRLGVLNKILGVIVRSMIWHFRNTKTEVSSSSAWDQRPWFRLFLNLVIDLNKPDPAFESIRLGIFSVFGSAFHVCQPLVMPGFAFAWLELVSHRHFLPNLLLLPGQKAWNIAHQLLIDHFLFLEPHLKRVDLTPPIKKLYEGTLRVLLVLLHDFPSFFAGYHLSLCNVIPENCVQLRNVVLSATPKGMLPPDPFTPNLKIDLLPEISQSPVILSNVLGPIKDIRGSLDAYLKDGSNRNFLSGLLPLLYKEGTTEVDAPKVNSLVAYIGAHALARLQNGQISLSRTPEMEVIQKLMELDDSGRYKSLNAIANQLRFPSSHTHYFSCVILYLFSESNSVAVKEQVTRVLLERLIVNRPHPWGLLITFIELIKNQRYRFWSYPFTRCATEIEKVFESVARSCMPPGAQRSTLVAGDDQ